MKKVIVTGANGFIGSALLEELSQNSVEVIAVIKNEKENIESIAKLSGVRIVYCDMDSIEMLPKLISDRDIDICIHLAWSGSSGNERADYKLQLLNVQYSLQVVDAIANMNVKRFVGAGTLAEKDVLNYHMRDGSTPNAVSIYGIAKISTHFMTKAECSKLGIEHVWCYLSNTYGIHNTTNNFINMASRLMLNGQHAAFTSGEQMYDFVYITDTVRGIYAAADLGKTNCAYYLGSTSPKKLKDYIKIIRDKINPDIKLYLGEIPFNGIPLSPEAYDTSKLETDTGYKPTISFEVGIEKTIEWLKAMQEGQDNV